jgi:nucleotidyltransferase/DNA polymerase involved in DNA repair
MRSYMVACAILPFLALRAALGDAQNRLLEPVALAPGHDGAARIGEVSEVARGLGVRPGMSLGEAIDICPSLSLISPDPARTGRIREAVLTRLEGIGAEVEPGPQGEAFFSAGQLERLYGNLDLVLAAAAEGLGPGARIAAAPTRLAAYAAARQGDPPADSSPSRGNSGSRGNTPRSNTPRSNAPRGNAPRGSSGDASRVGDRGRIIPPERLREYLGALPVAILADRLSGSEAQNRRLVSSLVKLGIHHLEGLAELPGDAVADRFGPLGTEARNLALGLEGPIRPRPPRESIAESLKLPEAASGSHLQGAVTILSDRIAARLAGLGASARSLAMEARLSGGGSWVREATPRQPTARADLLRMILLPGLEHLPRPAEQLKLRVVRLGPGDSEQIELTHHPEQTRHQRLGEAARQVRAAVGDSGLVRVLDAEVDSHLPERRLLLTPYLQQ